MIEVNGLKCIPVTLFIALSLFMNNPGVAEDVSGWLNANYKKLSNSSSVISSLLGRFLNYSVVFI